LSCLPVVGEIKTIIWRR